MYSASILEFSILFLNSESNDDECQITWSRSRPNTHQFRQTMNSRLDAFIAF